MASKIVTLRVSDEEFTKISRHSARAGLSVSATLRALIFDGLDDKRPDDILKELDSIRSLLTKVPEPNMKPVVDEIQIVKAAIAGLIEQHFLPTTPSDRKQSVRDILTDLKR